uniref:Uncharacterized protein n=1 Tax=Eutreptiella gymnastica TaxID=73025 RepID=A0A7S1N3H5_9EUGL
MKHVIEVTLATAQERGQGFVYLGLCSLRCVTTSSTSIMANVSYNQPCCGMCTHSYAIKKSAAGSMWYNMRDFRYKNPCYGMRLDRASWRRLCTHALGKTRQMCCRGNENEMAQWIPDSHSQNDWGPEGWFLPYLRSQSVGCAEVNVLREEKYPDFGIFHQMRDVFKSVITKH